MKIALNSSNLCRMARAAGWKGRRRLRSKTIARGSKMTVTQAQHLTKSRRAMPLRASLVGLVAGRVSADRRSVVAGKSGSVRVHIGGRRLIKKTENSIL